MVLSTGSTIHNSALSRRMLNVYNRNIFAMVVRESICHRRTFNHIICIFETIFRPKMFNINSYICDGEVRLFTGPHWAILPAAIL